MLFWSRTPLALGVAMAFAGATAGATTITVTSSDDSASSAPCNLRNAITAINFGNAVLFPGCQASLSGAFGNNDTIVFAASLANSTITLQQGQLSNYAPLTITGSGQTIDASARSRVLYTIAFLSVSNLTLAGGEAGASPGGGLYANQAFVSLSNVNVTGSHAASGGGLAIANGSANLSATRVTGNLSSSGRGGAGLLVNASNVTLANSTVSDNSAACVNACGGGVSAVNGSTLTINSSALARNSATASGSTVGGGVYATESKVFLINSTIAANTASGFDAVGAAAVENQATAAATRGIVLTNSSVSANSANSANASAASITGGLLVGSNGMGRATLANTIVAANSAMRAGNALTTADLIANVGAVTASNSLLGSTLQPAYSGNANVFSDAPALAALGNRGGPTETLALLGGSPAIDAGSNALAVNAASQPLTSDQTGRARTVNGSVDIGAFEFPGDVIFRDHFGS